VVLSLWLPCFWEWIALHRGEAHLRQNLC
jgi:hypothetical protein